MKIKLSELKQIIKSVIKEEKEMQSEKMTTGKFIDNYIKTTYRNGFSSDRLDTRKIMQDGGKIEEIPVDHSGYEFEVTFPNGASFQVVETDSQTGGKNISVFKM